MATAPLENSMVEKFLPEQQSADEWKRQSSKVPIGRWMFGFWMVRPKPKIAKWMGGGGKSPGAISACGARDAAGPNRR